MSSFEALLSYHPWMSYKDNRNLRSQSRTADENAAALCNLMKELKVNLIVSQELQALYHNKNVKEGTYWPGDSVRLSRKLIKIKKNIKLEHKYLDPFEILEAVGKQAYKLKLPSKWRIHPVFHVSLLERDVTKKEAVDQKIVDQLEFAEGEKPDQKVDLIMDSMVLAEEVIDGRSPGLYYLIHSKGKTYAEDTWKPVERIAHLQRLLQKYHAKNPENLTATSPPVDKGAPPPPMTA